MSKKVKNIFNTEVWLDGSVRKLRAFREELPMPSNRNYRVSVMVDENDVIAEAKLNSATLCVNFSLIEAGKYLERKYLERNTPEEIKSRREALGLTQKEFGEALGITSRTIRRWENPKRIKTPPGDIIDQIRCMVPTE